MASWKDNAIMFWDAEKVSDHGRAPLAIETERIERKERMIDGTMRRYLVATKHTISTSWENLPSTQYSGSGPVDLGMTGPAMKTFLEEAEDPFTVTLRSGSGETESYQVYVNDFGFEIVKRGPNVDLWSFNVSLVEV